MEPEDDGWEVQNRRNRGSREVDGSRSEIVKFFVSNIPQGCRPWDLADAFRRFRDIAGAFIAKKKDKEGRVFGFVSFKGVRDLDELKRNLLNVKLGGNKLVINVAFFARENGNNKLAFVGNHVGGLPAGTGNGCFPGACSKEKVSNPVKKGVSFLDILTSKSHVASEEDDLVIDPSTFSLSKLVDKAVTGRALGFKELRFLRSSLMLAGYNEASLQYLGGLSVLISFPDSGMVNKLLEDKEVWVRSFSSVQPWIGQSFPYERLAWVNILGVPPHLVSSVTFDAIGSRFGKVILASQFQENDGDLTYDRLGILVDTGNRINGVLNLSWQDKKIQGVVIEENAQWIPDFLEVGEDSVGISSELEGGKEDPGFASPANVGNGEGGAEESGQGPDVDFNKREKEVLAAHEGEGDCPIFWKLVRTR
ncbi:putative RNA recognition motif domain, nucleotide-binding alpha-beta plait domain superfamily [Helianthus annuus]|nr:putative RNA recognition motif domain, nucleotide-binding alpha-beta plait domain superfamily [Helianthus annuus]